MYGTQVHGHRALGVPRSTRRARSPQAWYKVSPKDTPDEAARGARPDAVSDAARAGRRPAAPAAVPVRRRGRPRSSPASRPGARGTSPATSGSSPGHFPGRPTLPGVLMVEAIAQLGAIAVLTDERFAGKLPLFGGLDGARFRRQVGPGRHARARGRAGPHVGPRRQGHGRGLRRRRGGLRVRAAVRRRRRAERLRRRQRSAELEHGERGRVTRNPEAPSRRTTGRQPRLAASCRRGRPCSRAWRRWRRCRRRPRRCPRP